MKKSLIFCIALLFGTVVSSAVLAEASKVPPAETPQVEKKEEGSGTTTPLPKDGPKPTPGMPIAKWPGLFDCGPTQVITDIIGKYEEVPFLQMNGVIQIPDGRTIPTGARIYFNPKTTTFSLVAHFQNGFSCIMFYGNSLAPITGQKSTQTPSLQNKGQQYFNNGDQKEPRQEHKIEERKFNWRGTSNNLNEYQI